MAKNKQSKLVTIVGALVLVVALGAVLLGIARTSGDPGMLTKASDPADGAPSASTLLAQEKALPFVKRFLELYTTGIGPGENAALLGDFMTPELQLRAQQSKRSVPFGIRSVLSTSECTSKSDGELVSHVVCPLTVYPVGAPEKTYTAQVTLTKKELSSGWLVDRVVFTPTAASK